MGDRRPGVYAWELPGVVGNACNGLTPTVALQLAAVVYGANLFSVLLEDLEAAWRDNSVSEWRCCCLVKGRILLRWKASRLREESNESEVFEGILSHEVALVVESLSAGIDRVITTKIDEETTVVDPIVAEMSRTESTWIEAESAKGDANSSCDGGGTHRRFKFFDFRYQINGASAWSLAPVWLGVRNFTVELSVEDLGEPIGLTMWELELPGVAGNACNGLTPTVALQLAAVVYGANLFSVLLEDLEAAWLLECLRTLVEGLAL
eukprot:Gb_16348 [translate_table: standard]